MINIVISPSQQSWNKCLLCDSEKEHCYLIGKEVLNILKDYDVNVFLIPKSVSGTEKETLKTIVDLSNAFIYANGGNGYHLDIHSDGGYNGSGASGFYFSENGKGFIMQIYREISKITPWNDGNVTKRDLYVLRNTYATAGLIEVSFHDKLEEAKWIHDNILNIAQAIVKGFESALGIKKIHTQTHWAEEHYTKLIESNIIINEKRFDDKVTRGELFALLSQFINK
jgi:N-acetylmuramoyl-L-alanine amidase